MTAKWEKQAPMMVFDIYDRSSRNPKGLTTAFNKVKGNLNVPGFRKGKFHAKYLTVCTAKKRYEDALNAVLPEAYEAAVKKQDRSCCATKNRR